MDKSTIKSAMAVCLVLMMAVWAAHEYQANNAADFYSSHPERVLYALGITAVVVAGVIVFRRLSPAVQRIATLLVVGVAAVVSSAASGYMCYLCLAWRGLRYDIVDGARLHAAPLYTTEICLGLALFSAVLAATAAASWYLFYRVLRKGTPKPP